MSGSSNNSWTIVTPEETAAAETLRPLTEGTERQDEPSAPTQGLGAEPSDGAHGLSEEDHPELTSEEQVAQPNEDSDACALPSSAPSEVQSSPVPEPQTEGAPLDSGLSSTEPESFSDSYSHLSPSSDETPAPPLSAETLGYLDSGQEKEEEEEAREQTEIQDETQNQAISQEPEEEESKEESKEESHQFSPIETPQDPTVQTAAPQTEPELRRRRLEALEKIGQRDEEEEAEEDFQLPQRDEDSGITLNKCILGAVILLGLGTIFISGVFMDLDEESDYPASELNEPESSGKQEWLNPDLSRPDAEAELLNKLTKGNEQIEMLQAQLQVLQSENEELKLTKAQAAEGSTEQLHHNEMQQENTAATTPPSGGTENDSQSPADYQAYKKNKHDRGVAKEWKDEEKSEWKKEKKQRKDGGKTDGKEKEWKREKYESGRFEKRYKEDKHSKQKDEAKEWKKDNSKRGDEGRTWKEKKEWTNEGDKKHKRDHFKEGRSKEGSKESKYYQETHKGPGDKHWKKGRDDYKEEKKDKYEKKHWKERDGYESQNRKDDGDRRDKSKDQKKWKSNDKKQWRNEEEERKGVGYKEKKHKKEREDGKSEKYNKYKGSEHKDQAWSDKKSTPPQPKVKVGQPEYWSRQRERLQHSSKPQDPCDSPDTCAQAEGVQPVPLSEFESILNDYLSKAEKAGVEASQIAELRKLATEMFQNGAFPHDQMSFLEYVEDVGDMLEDLVEGEDEEDGSGKKDSAIEDEMEGFEKEVMQKFTLPGEKEKVKAESMKESERGRG
ncbi:pre-B-cell leukemia homeobox interacting protein 1b isoform X1 [Boleophthalmus pectinirostris]|uniref:pre-B-cell leukemia homeobox interacting protein 1b isoform X1 n=1 Tax=Boleophthalmus pectinirostris TaxID=150288 RepID=UPI00242E930F|nr:pre-B-cell leukemia homeobox interacting protein 1b isoform X1 [Boleophthalmus pectinirostris]XP_055019687.1 pre-B-cell leukemia homeobox interacting protein 1b isoform X1 [Boleophthalmus pectinirostris]XP_055019688.1 pre-B-cell leukemia homeobox interacting protein 1b isoform X1 [Boleophthalmus pectinirostris]